jgi:hypothetical protein
MWEKADFRYHDDPETGLPHIYGHGITEREVEEVAPEKNRQDRGWPPSPGDICP